MTQLKPFVNIGPGDVIKDEMEFYGWSQKDLAEILDVSEKHISQLLTNKVPITANMARLLSSVFKQSPEFWISLDVKYRTSAEGDSQCLDAKKRAQIFSVMPVRDMQKKGWLPKNKDKLVEAVKKFWNIAELNFSMLDKWLADACYKKSEAFSSKFNAYFARTWVQKVILEAEKNTAVPTYSKEKLERLAENLHTYTATGKIGIEQFIGELKKCGVIFLVVHHLEKTYTDGAACWVNDRPVVALTARFSRVDNFWFTVAHEIGHVLLHSDRLVDNIFVDSTDNEDLLERQGEDEANNFAGHVLKYSQICQRFKGLDRISELRIKECASQENLHPGIIVGYLQYEKMLSYRNLNHLKVCVKDTLEKFSISQDIV